MKRDALIVVAGFLLIISNVVLTTIDYHVGVAVTATVGAYLAIVAGMVNVFQNTKIESLEKRIEAIEETKSNE